MDISNVYEGSPEPLENQIEAAQKYFEAKGVEFDSGELAMWNALKENAATTQGCYEKG